MILTSLVSVRESRSMQGGCVLGMAQIKVTPPAKAAALHDAQSSLWVAPEGGSRGSE